MATLVDPYGNPISSAAWRFQASSNRYSGTTPPDFIRAFDPLKKLITYQDWLTVSYLSDKLYTNFPVVEGAISQKAMFATGKAWKPVFLGKHKKWGQIAREWLVENWYPACDPRGPNFGFVDGLYLQSTAICRTGDTIEIEIIDDSGWPLIQTIPSRQIGQWDFASAVNCKVKGGEWDGENITNGVITDDYECPLAYRKLGEVNGEFEDIPAECVIHTFEPKWLDQSRGFPVFTSSIEDFRRIAKSDEWEQQAMLIASSIGLLEYNESGEAETPELDPLNLTADDQTPTGLQAKTLYGGLIRYLKSNSGKLEQFVSNRPGDDWEKFQDRQIRKALTAANWPYALVWKPDGTNGTVQRSELLKARMSVVDRQALLAPRARRKVAFAISAAIEAGFIPPYPGTDKGGHLKWGFTLPPKISIDDGRDRAQRREDAKYGVILDSTIVEEDGDLTYEEHCRLRWRDAAILELTRQEAEEIYGIKLDPRLGKMLTPNEAPDEDEDNDADDQKP